VFSDGGRHKLADFEGKVLVLFLYEQDCPRCRGEIPNRNKVVEQFKDKPVKFIAVGAGDTAADVTGYVRGTKLAMAGFADNLGLMETRYGTHISLQNIWQFRVIGPDGKIVGYTMEPAEIERALSNVKWKYKDGGYDPKLNNVIDLLEWNQYAKAVPLLKSQMKVKAVAESAAKLMEAVKAEGKAWLDAAEQAKGTDPVKAYDLYTKVSTAFAGDDLGKTADAALKGLKADKAVAAELAARKMYEGLHPAMAKAKPTPAHRASVVQYCMGISKKYPDTPTGKQAAELAKEIEDAALSAAAK
jgi:peroxiredoxin